jgi:acyl-CoA synthetase (AMP-forming)/AMP-acid ligase II/acyl carrier protein
MAVHPTSLPKPGSAPATLVELLRLRADSQYNGANYIFSSDGESEETSWSYSDLDRKARSIAVSLQSRGLAGKHAVLLYPPGLEFIGAFFGCLYAAVVAVPAYPPDPARLNRSLPRFQAIVADSNAVVVLTTQRILSSVEPLLKHAGLRFVATDMIEDGQASQWRTPDVNDQTIAFLQYTSGSTGKPKGVMLTHKNLLHNAGLVYRAVEHAAGDKYVSWLPAFHDMGFVAGILEPLYAEIPAILMPPIAFLQKPSRWLQAISRHRATTSGGPNFAYDLCVRKITDQERGSLDLSSWSVAFNGAEPIRAETIDRFAAAFKPCGFRREAFFPCYGLAEATLIVSGGAKSDPPVIKKAQARELEAKRLIEDDSADARPIVGCGTALMDQRIAIVDPESLTECSEGQVGEIWVQGPSVARGYWNQPEETARVFQAELAADHDGGTFLRTGDLGVVKDGELFITGRIKDLIIIRGRNLYPQDVEATIERSRPTFRPGCTAAFSIEVGGQERLAAVQEVTGSERFDEIIGELCRAVIDEHEVQLYAVAFIEAGTIPKTSSGKIQRRACKEEFLNGSLSLLYKWQAPDAQEVKEDILSAAPSLEDAEAIRRWLVSELAAKMGVDASELEPRQSIARYGIDSLAAVEFKHSIETHLRVVLPLDDLLHNYSIDQLADRIKSQPSASPGTIPPVSRAKAPMASFDQQQFWMLEQMEPGCPYFNIAVAFRLLGPINLEALEHSFAQIIRRHESLRTTFDFADDRLHQIISPSAIFALHKEDVSAPPANGRGAQVLARLVEEARRPFDFRKGPLLRASLFKIGAQEHALLLVIHHIISDGWSVGIILNELSAFYNSYLAQTVPALPELPVQFADFAHWQRARLESSEESPDWLKYWGEQLQGSKFSLSLPLDFPRPKSSSRRGARRSVRLEKSLYESLKEMSRRQGVTLFVTLLSAFKALLYYYCNQQDIVVIAPTANRELIETMGMVGCLRNLLVLRTHLQGKLQFKELIQRIEQVWLDAYAHRHVPLGKLVESLQLKKPKNNAPLFPVMFAFQSFPAEAPSLERLSSSTVEVPLEISNRDLTLYVDPYGDDLVCAFEYDAELFKAETIDRMLETFHRILKNVAHFPDQPLSNIDTESAPS